VHIFTARVSLLTANQRIRIREKTLEFSTVLHAMKFGERAFSHCVFLGVLAFG